MGEKNKEVTGKDALKSLFYYLFIFGSGLNFLAVLSYENDLHHSISLIVYSLIVLITTFRENKKRINKENN